MDAGTVTALLKSILRLLAVLRMTKIPSRLQISKYLVIQYGIGITSLAQPKTAQRRLKNSFHLMVASELRVHRMHHREVPHSRSVRQLSQILPESHPPADRDQPLGFIHLRFYIYPHLLEGYRKVMLIQIPPANRAWQSNYPGRFAWMPATSVVRHGIRFIQYISSRISKIANPNNRTMVCLTKSTRIRLPAAVDGILTKTCPIFWKKARMHKAAVAFQPCLTRNSPGNTCDRTSGAGNFIQHRGLIVRPDHPDQTAFIFDLGYFRPELELTGRGNSPCCNTITPWLFPSLPEMGCTRLRFKDNKSAAGCWLTRAEPFPARPVFTAVNSSGEKSAVIDLSGNWWITMCFLVDHTHPCFFGGKSLLHGHKEVHGRLIQNGRNGNFPGFRQNGFVPHPPRIGRPDRHGWQCCSCRTSLTCRV